MRSGHAKKIIHATMETLTALNFFQYRQLEFQQKLNMHTRVLQIGQKFEKSEVTPS